MECNKDEALRAKQVAEKKMANNDFEGARKIALKARNLYPELENISQLLSICDVHCSAQKRPAGSEKDWYAILQVENSADDLTVKKQYRRLALFLHPDKNQHPGAEAAFKLICEAHAVLSDPIKKSQYDSRLRFSFNSKPVIPPHHMNAQFHMPVQNPKGFSFDFQRYRASHLGTGIRLDMFSSVCPFCGFNYQFDRRCLNVKLLCQKCSRHFTAFDISSAGNPQMPLNPAGNQYASYQCGSQNSMNKRDPQRGTVSSVNLGQCGTKISEDLKSKDGASDSVKPAPGGKKTRKDQGNAVRKDKKSANHRRAKSFVVDSDSSKSAESSTDSDLEVANPSTGLNSETSRVHFPRRSSRKRKIIYYNEVDDDDDDSGGGDDDDEIPTTLKGTQREKLSSDEPDEPCDAMKDDMKDGFPAKADYLEKQEIRITKPGENLGVDDGHNEEVTVKTESSGASVNKISTDSEQDSGLESDSDKVFSHAADPEFSDFEKDRDEKCFAVGQYWACYDQSDSMPRFYRKVDWVSTTPFEVGFTWLEVDPMDKFQRDWVECNFPVGCGNFRLGDSDTTSERLTFSHQVHFDKSRRRRSQFLCPRKGEIWALFRDWNMGWTSKKHFEYKYELVEVLSDLITDAGIRVCYLCKVEGFVSIFQRSGPSEDGSFVIRPNDLYRFSHNIPFRIMTGTEREGVPNGSFELDPACLPMNPGHLFYPGKQTLESKATRH